MLPVLVSPALIHRSAFLLLYEDCAIGGMEEWCEDHRLALTDFDAFLTRLKQEAAGIGVDPEWSPTSHFWLQLGDDLVGTLRVRHALTPAVAARAGHLGYDVAPSHRRRGLGSEIARLGLIETQKLGIRDVLAICEETNLASRKIIESHGGVIDRIHRGEVRYWIPLTHPPE